MKFSESFQEAVRAALAYPELNWGHSRIVISQSPSEFTATFTMERPKLAGISPDNIDRLRCFCLVLDMVTASVQFISIVGEAYAPTLMTLPFSEPSDWSSAKINAPCPIEFDAESSQVFFSLSIS